MNFIPSSTALLSLESGFVGCADVDKAEHGQIVTVRAADAVAPFSRAVTETLDWPLGVAAAVAAKVPEDDEAGMFTEPGTVRAGLPLDTATATPPLGAGPESVIVQVLLEPALRLAGLHINAFSCKGTRFSVTVAAPPLFEEPVMVAVMVTLRPVVTVPANAVKVAEEAPDGTCSVAGMVSRELLSVR
jgi:hypothetical protein